MAIGPESDSVQYQCTCRTCTGTCIYEAQPLLCYPESPQTPALAQRAKMRIPAIPRALQVTIIAVAVAGMARNPQV